MISLLKYLICFVGFMTFGVFWLIGMIIRYLLKD